MTGETTGKFRYCLATSINTKWAAVNMCNPLFTELAVVLKAILISIGLLYIQKLCIN